MSTVRKITGEVPRDLLEIAQQAGATQTVRAGLRLLAAPEACQHLLRMRGKVRFSKKPAELKSDR